MMSNDSSNYRLPEQDDGALRSFQEFLQIVRRLRVECPWDREQTHGSLRPMLIEEAYETVEAIDQAIDTGDYTELKKELGDLLLHILFHTDLAREEGYFTLEEVVQAECDKLIYRHPHVFGDVVVAGAEEVTRNWEQLKRREKGRNSVLDGVPASLPALQRAARIQERAAKVGFDWPDSGSTNGAPESVWEKVREEVLEFEEELKKAHASEASGVGYRVSGVGGAKGKESPKINDNGSKSLTSEASELQRPDTRHPIPDARSEEFGDLLFSLVNLARHEGIDPEGALRHASYKFGHRFRKIEAVVEASGRPFSDYTLEEMDAIWDRVKLEG